MNKIKIADVDWTDLWVGQPVSVSSLTDVMGGVIARLDSAPMIWIAWDDGNRYEYAKSVVGHVDLMSGSRPVQAMFDPSFSDRLFGDPEGE